GPAGVEPVDAPAAEPDVGLYRSGAVHHRAARGTGPGCRVLDRVGRLASAPGAEVLLEQCQHTGGVRAGAAAEVTADDDPGAARPQRLVGPGPDELRGETVDLVGLAADRSPDAMVAADHPA